MPRSKIELRHVRYIIAAAERGSFRRAAQHLGVEQSAISRRIRDVEDEIGVQLFRRHPAGVDLTDIGKLFLNQAAPGARQIGSALDGARTMANEGRHLRIGVFGPLTMGFLSQLFGAFREHRPGVKLQFNEGSCSELIAAVRRGRLDVGIVAEPMPAKGFDLMPLWAEPVYVAMPDGDPLADQTVLRWDDLHDRRFLVTDLPAGDFARHCLMRNLRPSLGDLQIERLSVTRESLMQIVAHGDGVTIAGSAHVRQGLPGIVFRMIEGAVLRYSAVHPRRALHRDLDHLLALAKSLSQRDEAWFARQGLMRPEHWHVSHRDRHCGAHGQTPDRFQ